MHNKEIINYDSYIFKNVRIKVTRFIPYAGKYFTHQNGINYIVTQTDF